MGYREEFKIPVSDTQAYKQFGNSVVVPVIEYLAKALVQQVARAKFRSPVPVTESESRLPEDRAAIA